MHINHLDCTRHTHTHTKQPGCPTHTDATTTASQHLATKRATTPGEVSNKRARAARRTPFAGTCCCCSYAHFWLVLRPVWHGSVNAPAELRAQHPPLCGRTRTLTSSLWLMCADADDAGCWLPMRVRLDMHIRCAGRAHSGTVHKENGNGDPGARKATTGGQAGHRSTRATAASQCNICALRRMAAAADGGEQQRTAARAKVDGAPESIARMPNRFAGEWGAFGRCGF